MMAKTVAVPVLVLCLLGLGGAATPAPTTADSAAAGGGVLSTDLASDPAAFNMDMMIDAAMPKALVQAILEAGDVFQSVIVGDVPDLPALTATDLAQYCTTSNMVKSGGMTQEDCQDAPEMLELGWFAVVALMGLLDVPIYSGPIDDMLLYFAMDSTLDANTLMTSGYIYRRTKAQDPSQRPFLAIIQINPATWQALLVQGELKQVLMHEMIHSLGLGTTWPTPAGCGNRDDCIKVVKSGNASLALAGVPYKGKGVKGRCYADEVYRALCEKESWCTPGPLLMETVIDLQQDPNFSSNCGHWAELQLAGELVSTTAIGATAKLARLGTRLHLTAVSVAGLQDLGYIVNYKSKAIEPFSSIIRRRRTDRAWL